MCVSRERKKIYIHTHEVRCAFQLAKNNSTGERNFHDKLHAGSRNECE